MLATKENITEYIPQRDPVIMVHDLLEATDTNATTQLNVEMDNVFVSNGFFTEPGLVENIAQTAAVHVGFQCRSKGYPIPIGYIAAIKDLRIITLPPANSVLTTSVRVTNKVLDVTVVQGEVKLKDEVLCTCEMRIFAKIQP